MHPRRLVAVLVVTLVAAACGRGSMDGAHMDDDHRDHGGAFAFGEPASAAEADRVIEVRTTDQLAFEPRAFTVAVGEVVTFRVTNPGQIGHDFTLGDEAAQEEHEAMMAQMAGMPMEHRDANAMLVPPGETRELTWRSTTPGTVLIGCHQPGHWNVGMRATITVG